MSEIKAWWSNYAFKPIAEQALRSNQTLLPQRLNAALGVPMKLLGMRGFPVHYLCTLPVIGWFALLGATYLARWSVHELEVGGWLLQRLAHTFRYVVLPTSFGIVAATALAQIVVLPIGMFRMVTLEAERTYLHLCAWIVGLLHAFAVVFLVRTVL